MPNCKSVALAVAGLFAISESLSSTKPLDHHRHVTSSNKVHSHDKEEQRPDLFKQQLSHMDPTIPQALHETKAHRRSGNISGDHTPVHFVLAPKAKDNSAANASSTASISKSGPNKEEQRPDLFKQQLSHMDPTIPQALHETKAHRRSGNISGDHTPLHFVLAPKAKDNRAANASSTASISKSGPKVRIEVFYETLCPYCEQFFMEQLKPLWEDPEFSPFLDVGLYPSGNMMTQPVESISEGYKFFHPEIEDQDLDHVFQCQHGPDECLGNMVQACTMKSASNMSQALPLIFCMASRTASGAESMEKIAYDCLGEAQLDLEPILQCMRGPVGNRHMFEIGNYSDNLLPPKQWVPWVTIDGEALEIENPQALAGGLCERLPEDVRPAACAMANEPEEKKPLIKRLIPWLDLLASERRAAREQHPRFCHPAHDELKQTL